MADTFLKIVLSPINLLYPRPLFGLPPSPPRRATTRSPLKQRFSKGETMVVHPTFFLVFFFSHMEHLFLGPSDFPSNH